jgi:hypothetical protein
MHILGATFFHGKCYELILKKMDWATFWAIYFTNSSGHSARGHLSTYPYGSHAHPSYTDNNVNGIRQKMCLRKLKSGWL